MKKVYSYKGKKYHRIGKCNRCGACRLKCPHFKWVNGLATCMIYDKRSEICEECSAKYAGKRKITHQNCINFPNHPGLSVIESGKCGYKFIEIK